MYVNCKCLENLKIGDIKTIKIGCCFKPVALSFNDNIHIENVDMWFDYVFNGYKKKYREIGGVICIYDDRYYAVPTDIGNITSTKVSYDYYSTIHTHPAIVVDHNDYPICGTIASTYDIYNSDPFSVHYVAGLRGLFKYYHIEPRVKSLTNAGIKLIYSYIVKSILIGWEELGYDYITEFKKYEYLVDIGEYITIIKRTDEMCRFIEVKENINKINCKVPHKLSVMTTLLNYDDSVPYSIFSLDFI